MNKAQSLQDFWSSFGIKAYDENSVPEKTEYPYLTYSAITDSLENIIPMSASIWYRGTSWKDISDKAEEISKELEKGKLIELDKGYTYIYRGSPFARRVGGFADDMVKQIYLNINVEYLTY